MTSSCATGPPARRESRPSCATSAPRTLKPAWRLGCKPGPRRRIALSWRRLHPHIRLQRNWTICMFHPRLILDDTSAISAPAPQPPLPDLDAMALDAYSRTVSGVVERLGPAV